MGSANYIFANTGQTVRLIIQVLGSDGHPCDLDGYGNWLDGYGYLMPDGYYSDAPDGYYLGPDGHSDVYHTDSDYCVLYDGPNDGYYAPVVNQVILPDLSLAVGYPRPMVRLGVGLYVSGLQIPLGVPAIGTYIASISWTYNYQFVWETYAINAARPFGITSVTPV